jgi:hypothetical protein
MDAPVDDETTLLRVAMPDRVGSLARIAGRFAEAGIDIVRVEVVSADGAVAVDDLLVRGRDPERVVAKIPSEAKLLGVRPHAMLPDPGLAMAAACARITDAHSLAAARTRLVDAALSLADAHAGVLLRSTGRGSLRPVASTVGRVEPVRLEAFPLAQDALERDHAATASGDLLWAPPSLRAALHGGAVAVVPVGEPRCLVLCIVRADWFPFVAAELERLRALARVASGVLRAHGERAVAAPDDDATLEPVG